jgi:hypothetical protein
LEKIMSPIIHTIVAVVFGILAIAFLAVFGALVIEFSDAGWQAIATLYGQLFVFFPTFGLLALVAFYYPACVFLDMYWNHVAFGRLRVIAGTMVLVLGSWFLAQTLLSGVPAIWQVTPTVLKADRGEPAGCDPSQQSCLRAPVLDAGASVRIASQQRSGLSEFSRTCNPDRLLPPPPTLTEQRYCFASGSMMTAAQCCQAQSQFRATMERLHAIPENRALTGKVHAWVLPFIAFFLFTLFIIGAMLVVRREALAKYYPRYMRRIERGVLIGAFAMLFWPLSNHAYIQTSSVIYGGGDRSLFIMLAPGFSILFGAWALMLLFFFFRRYKEDVEVVGKITGVIVSAIAFTRYDELIGYFERFAGAGAGPISLGMIGAVIVIALLQLLIWNTSDSEAARATQPVGRD